MTSDVMKYRQIKSLSVKSHNSVQFAIMNSRQQASCCRRYLKIDLLNPLANFEEFEECCTSTKMKTNLRQFALGILNFCDEKKSQGTQTIDIDILEEINENASVDQISILVSNLWLKLDGHSKLKLLMLFFSDVDINTQAVFFAYLGNTLNTEIFENSKNCQKKYSDLNLKDICEANKKTFYRTFDKRL